MSDYKLILHRAYVNVTKPARGRLYSKKKTDDTP